MTAFIIGLVLAVTPVAVAVPFPDVTAIIKQMKEVFVPVHSSTRKVVISVHIRQGGKTETTQWVAGQACRELPDGKQILTVILEPESWRGYAFLVQKREEQPSTIRVYLPALRQSVPVSADEHFLDTDFIYADLGFGRLHSTYRLLGEEEHGGRRLYKVEEVIPQDEPSYSRIITWVTIDSLLPLQRDYYDMRGTLWKTELFDKVSTIDGVPTPLRITMQDVLGDTSTSLSFKQVRYDVDIPDKVFDPQQLARAADLSLWQAYGSESARKK